MEFKKQPFDNITPPLPSPTRGGTLLSYIGYLQRNTVDIVFSKKTTTFNVGDIVIAKHPFQNKEIIKQIAKITGEKIELRGLNNDESEDSRVYGSVAKKDVLRIVVAKK
ncbi:MAG: hypothetical protein UV18_C0002G0039 [Candidatus Magasanikbacteria bacterium GW2011_GWC2_42_27]|nr:MAG: hypothetical protein UV18_C0002G0039 [Candidatus Magasanikbacteria bacterium GW2011_GWC2_42_27]